MTTTVALMTADVGDLSQWTSYGGLSRDTSTKRTGSSSYKLTGPVGYVGTAYRTIAPRSDYYVRWGLLPTWGGLCMSWREGSTSHITLKWLEASGLFQLLRGDYYSSTVIAQGNLQLPADQWGCLETYAVINDSTGAFSLKLNGVADSGLTLTNIDTRNGGTIGQIDNCMWASHANGPTQYIDDIKFCYGGWPGQYGIYVSDPAAAGSNTAWTASSGTALACVQGLPPSMTDYILTDGGVAGTKSDFTPNALPLTPGSMGAVGVISLDRLNVAGSGTVRNYIDSNGTVANGADAALDVSAKYVEAYFDLDPDGNVAWTKAKADALKFGIETR